MWQAESRNSKYNPFLLVTVTNYNLTMRHVPPSTGYESET